MAALTRNVRRHLDRRRFRALRFGRESRSGHIVTLNVSRVIAKPYVIHRRRIARTAKVLACPRTNIIAFLEIHANFVRLGNKAANHELVGIAKFCSTRIHYHTRIRAPLRHLHDSAHLVYAIFIVTQRRLSWQVFCIRCCRGTRSTCAASTTAKVAHSSAKVKARHHAKATACRSFGTAIRSNHIDRIRGRNIVRIVLARKEHYHVALGRNSRIAKDPTARELGVITQCNALEAHRSIARIIKFKPTGIIPVVILEVCIRRRNFRENHREIADKRHNRIDSNHTRVFARERAIVRAVAFLGR